MISRLDLIHSFPQQFVSLFSLAISVDDLYLLVPTIWAKPRMWLAMFCTKGKSNCKALRSLVFVYSRSEPGSLQHIYIFQVSQLQASMIDAKGTHMVNDLRFAFKQDTFLSWLAMGQRKIFFWIWCTTCSFFLLQQLVPVVELKT